MSGSVISVKNVGKSYKTYQSFGGRLLDWFLPFTGQHHKKTWVIRHVSFEVNAGDAIGIIGYNGAGKSTLLKIVTGTTAPSEGSVAVQGRVSALLELGMGFHPDFTGRQNVLMSGQLLGLTTEQVLEKMPDIERFAEIGAYIDQPVRTYSSGMQVRLAFSVATCVRPEILIVDEALSVGDAYFQHKSFDRIRQFRDQGTTLLFVSHSAGAVKTLCNRAILIDQGGVVKDGSPVEVLDFYNAIIARREKEAEVRQAEAETGQSMTRSGGGQAKIQALEMLDDQGQPIRTALVGQTVSFHVCVEVNGDIDQLTAGVLIRDVLGNEVFGTNTFHHHQSIDKPSKGSKHTIVFDVTSLDLGQGSYSVSVALHNKDAHTTGNYDWWDNALVFQVILGSQPMFVGTSSLPVSVHVLPTD